jgi:hypothetical protein
MQSLLKDSEENLSANIELTIHKALIRSVMNCAYADIRLLKLQRLKNKVIRTTGIISEAHTGPRAAHGFPSTMYL